MKTKDRIQLYNNMIPVLKTGVKDICGHKIYIGICLTAKLASDGKANFYDRDYEFPEFRLLKPMNIYVDSWFDRNEEGEQIRETCLLFMIELAKDTLKDEEAHKNIPCSCYPHNIDNNTKYIIK